MESELLKNILNEVESIKLYLFQFESWIFGLGIGMALLVFCCAFNSFRSREK